MADLTAFEDKHVFIVGAGREGKSVQRLFLASGHQRIHLLDQQDGDNYLAPIFEVPEKNRVVIKSSGVPPDNLGTTYITPTTFFFDLIKPMGATVVGITGTKGKSTTASMIAHVLSKSGVNYVFGGNIGIPMTDLLPEITTETIVVLELSSFMLLELRASPHIAVITNFFSDHLDFHGSRERYLDAKLNIVRFQSACDFYVRFSDEGEIEKLAKVFAGAEITSGRSLNVDLPQVVGEHNRALASLAVETLKLLGVSADSSVDALSSYKPLPHRLEYVRTVDNLHFVNDSIASQQDAAALGVRVVHKHYERLVGLIVGGLDRGDSVEALVRAIIEVRPQRIACLSSTGVRIRNLLPPGYECRLFEEEELELAIRWIIEENSSAHGAVLLSPGAPCYLLGERRVSTRWENFEARGAEFREIIQRL